MTNPTNPTAARLASSVAVIIPARLGATRLPNKPLADIGGKTMLQRVCERAQAAQTVGRVLVATPDTTIFNAVQAWGGEAVMTSPDCRTGTDRVAEAAHGLPHEFQIIVNVQGDEPLIEPATIDAVANALQESESGDVAEMAEMASMMCPVPPGRESDPNVVKVVCDTRGFALYFSRAALPFRRDTNAAQSVTTFQHVGLYAYRRDFLPVFTALAPTPLEQAESLEQLRALENGYRIRMALTERAPESVDTPDDLERVRALIAAL